MSPYQSKAQQGLFHSKNSPVGPDVVKEFDQASKGMTGLPYKKKPSILNRIKAGSKAGSKAKKSKF